MRNVLLLEELLNAINNMSIIIKIDTFNKVYIYDDKQIIYYTYNDNDLTFQNINIEELHDRICSTNNIKLVCRMINIDVGFTKTIIDILSRIQEHYRNICTDIKTLYKYK